MRELKKDAALQSSHYLARISGGVEINDGLVF
jgi:hypothetical protein